MSTESVLVGNVADFSEHTVLVLVSVAPLHLLWVVALLLLPLLVTFVVDDFVAILVWVELVLVLLVVHVMLLMYFRLDLCVIDGQSKLLPVISTYLSLSEAYAGEHGAKSGEKR